ncbi:ABC transporter ATP-binding protein [Vagococcus jeotgali]|uniref:ABC transporter ATP-binding protein n=1 Tax=Vagococcus jeotgali TaxID=3109030 RepID=UPI002DD9F750|nr:ABC transporter ATP-binding protein [Vagococcus sp. B2T-5]
MEERGGYRVEGSEKSFSLKAFLQLIQKTKPKYLLLVIGMLLLMVSSGIQVYVPKLAATLVDGFATGINQSLLIKVVILFVLSAIVSAIGGTILGVFGEDVIKKLRNMLWNKLLTLKVSYYDTVKAGETSSRLVNDTAQVKHLLATVFPQTLSSLILVIGSVYMMFRMDWRMSVAMLVVVPIVVIIMIPIFKFGSKVGRLRQDSLAGFNGVASETFSEIRLVKTSNAEKQTEKKAQKEINTLFSVGKKEAIFDAIMQPMMMMIMMSMIFGLLAYGMYRISKGEMEIGTLLSFLMYLFNLIGALPSIATLFSELAKASGSTERVQGILDEESEDYTSGINVDLSGDTLKMNHVNFSYEDSDSILKNISIEAKPNQVIAFAGPSGGGKSTLFGLIERFYEPDSGEIMIGNTNIKDINLLDYRSQIGYVAQDSSIMSGTIRDNLIFGLEGEFSDEKLWQVLELAYAKVFVKEMPNQLDTEVGERGVKISGGQRQRLAIARAFLRDPKLLMLDEATASLDSESEMMVQKALANLMENRTTLVIAHRLSTIVDSDVIYFIEKGTITGSGNHENLVAEHKTYARYVSEQFKLNQD